MAAGDERSNFLNVARPGGLDGPTPGSACSAGARPCLAGGASVAGMAFRLLGALAAIAAIWVAARTLLAAGGRPGTAVVTLVYVLVGVAVQPARLGLAYLLVQGLPGQRLFRVVFLLPMMITPVGVAYMFRMLTDTGKGPLQPLFAASGSATSPGSTTVGRPDRGDGG